MLTTYDLVVSQCTALITQEKLPQNFRYNKKLPRALPLTHNKLCISIFCYKALSCQSSFVYHFSRLIIHTVLYLFILHKPLFHLATLWCYWYQTVMISIFLAAEDLSELLDPLKEVRTLTFYIIFTPDL